MKVYTRFGGKTTKPGDVLEGVPSGVADRWLRFNIAEAVDGDEPEDKPLDEYTKAELVEYAEKAGIEIDSKAKKEVILKDFQTALGGE